MVAFKNELEQNASDERPKHFGRLPIAAYDNGKVPLKSRLSCQPSNGTALLIEREHPMRHQA